MSSASPHRSFSTSPGPAAGSSSSASDAPAPPTASSTPASAALPAASEDSRMMSSSSSRNVNEDEDEDDGPPPGANWWERWTHERPMPPRYAARWWKEWAIIFTVFGVTGSSSLYVVRPLLHEWGGLQGSMRDGPNSYRLISMAVLMPAYSIMLVALGTVAGRHHYFRRAALRMWGRILPLHKLGITAKPPPVPRRAKKQ